MKRMIEDKDAQAAGVVVFILVIAMFSFIYILCGVFFDQLIVVNNDMMSNLHYTSLYADMIGLARSYWYALPVIIFIGSIIWLIKNAITAKTEEVR